MPLNQDAQDALPTRRGVMTPPALRHRAVPHLSWPLQASIDSVLVERPYPTPTARVAVQGDWGVRTLGGGHGSP